MALPGASSPPSLPWESTLTLSTPSSAAVDPTSALASLLTGHGPETHGVEGLLGGPHARPLRTASVSAPVLPEHLSVSAPLPMKTLVVSGSRAWADMASGAADNTVAVFFDPEQDSLISSDVSVFSPPAVDEIPLPEYVARFAARYAHSGDHNGPEPELAAALAEISAALALAAAPNSETDVLLVLFSSLADAQRSHPALHPFVLDLEDVLLRVAGHLVTQLEASSHTHPNTLYAHLSMPPYPLDADLADAVYDLVGLYSPLPPPVFAQALPTVYLQHPLDTHTQSALCGPSSPASAELDALLSGASLECTSTAQLIAPTPRSRPHHLSTRDAQTYRDYRSSNTTYDASDAPMYQAAFWTTVILLLIFLSASCAICCMPITRDPILYRTSPQ